MAHSFPLGLGGSVPTTANEAGGLQSSQQGAAPTRFPVWTGGVGRGMGVCLSSLSLAAAAILWQEFEIAHQFVVGKGSVKPLVP